MPAHRLHTAAQCREIDRIAISDLAVSGFELMSRAGRAAFDCLLDRWPGVRSVTVCCGKGNNAGDGYVVALLARRFGLEVELLQVGDAGLLSGDAARARAAAAGVGVTARHDWPAAPAGDVVVDALLGTGLKGALAQPYAAAVDWINRSGRPVLALDLPTGVDADSGGVTEPVVRATVTLSFIGRKVGLHTGPGLAAAGERRFAGLGVGDDLRRRVSGFPLLEYPGLEARYRLTRRDPGAYKQSFGHVVVVGGDQGMGGAPLMAAEAALRVGAGLVTVVTRSAHRPAMLARRPEAMVVDADDRAARRGAFDRATCLVVGPGLGRETWGGALLDEALESGKCAVVDADGLVGLASRGRGMPGRLVLTPHPGEAAALLGSTSAAVQADRLTAARAIATRFAGVAVLKGAGTVIASPDDDAPDARVLGVCAHGNPGMASAGMGDILAGVIGGLLGQGLAPVEAAVAGTCLHSFAADRAARRLGERSLLATDLLERIVAILAREARA